MSSLRLSRLAEKPAVETAPLVKAASHLSGGIYIGSANELAIEKNVAINFGDHYAIKLWSHSIRHNVDHWLPIIFQNFIDSASHRS